MEHFDSEIEIREPKISRRIYLDTESRSLLEALRSALLFAKSTKELEIVIPKGVYNIPETEQKEYFMLSDLEDVTINGQGSELIFSSPVPYFDLYKSKGIKIKNLILDWDWDKKPLAAVGVVTAISPDGQYIDFTYPTVDTVDENKPFSIVGPFDRKRYTPGENRAFEFRPYKNKHFHAEDTEMEKLVRELSNIFVEGSAERVGKNILRFKTYNPEWGKTHFSIGQCFNFRYFEYDGCAVKGAKCSEITLEDITIHGCPGHGFLFSGGVEKIHFQRCKIAPKPGTDRSISISVDCLHVGNSKGMIVIENCDFSYAGDDCINLHDNSSMGIERLDEKILKAYRVDEKAMQFESGSVIEIRNPDLSPTTFSANVENVEYNAEKRYAILKLDRQIPECLSPDCIIFNRSFHTDYYIIRNNRFSNNRARGILLQSSHGRVENNVFENIQGAAIQIETGAESRWSEGQGVLDLLIQNNTIRSCDLNGWQMAVIYMGVYLPSGRTDYPVFKDIEISNNTIVDIPRQAFFSSSADNVLFANNTIINAMQRDLEENSYGSSQQEEPIYNERYEVVVQGYKTTNLIVENNKIVSTLI